MNSWNNINPENITMETAVREGLTKFVKENLKANPALSNHIIRREVDTSKYRERGSHAEYENRESMLELAIERGWRDIAEILLDAGADPNYKSRSGEYSVMGACKKYGDEKLLELLVRHGGVDDGTPLLHEPIRRTRQEELYGRGGNFIANFMDQLHERLLKARKRQYVVAQALADRDCYKVLDKILVLFGCNSMADFVRSHESYVAKAGVIADEDMAFIMKAEFGFSGAFHAEPIDIDDQMQFIKRAIEHGVDGNGTIPQADEKNAPVLLEFMKKEFGEAYRTDENRALAHMRERLYEAYLTLFPAEELEVGELGVDVRHNESEDCFREKTCRFVRAVPSIGAMFEQRIKINLRDIGVEDSEATIWSTTASLKN